MIAREKYFMIDLKPYLNADGISFDHNPSDGFFGLMSSFPAEELPESNEVVLVNGVPFIFPCKEDGEENNIECYHEEVEVEGHFTCLHVLGCCDNGSFLERIIFVCTDTEVAHMTGLSKSSCKEPLFHEEIAFQCTHLHSPSGTNQIQSHIWHQTIPLDAQNRLQKILLPDNPCFHIFAMTLEKELK